MHGDERRPEDQQQDSDVDDAGRLPRRPQDQGGVPQPGALQVGGDILFKNIVVFFFNLEKTSFLLAGKFIVKLLVISYYLLPFSF